MILGRLSELTTPAGPWDRAPLRGELFGIERLEEHARSLAAAQPVTSGRSRARGLANRLAGNAEYLLRANRAMAGTAGEGHHATPAAEWLADNYHPRGHADP